MNMSYGVDIVEKYLKTFFIILEGVKSESSFGRCSIYLYYIFSHFKFEEERIHDSHIQVFLYKSKSQTQWHFTSYQDLTQMILVIAVR